MRVSIWDLDYYYAQEKVNCFNPDVMKISSYHKQKGDTVNFVLCPNDIRQPFDIYYIIKENNKTPNPPLDLQLNKKVKWWGKAYEMKIKWKMPNAMLGCRPDYLLYPEYNTQLERAEHVRFFNNRAKLLPIYQDYHNTFKKKKIIVTDEYMWDADKDSIIIALKRLEDIKNLYFLKEIQLQRILYDKDIKEQFLKLTFTPGVNFKWSTIELKDFPAALDFLLELKKKNPYTDTGELEIKFINSSGSHWVSRENAIKDFDSIRNCIVAGKKNKVQVKVHFPESFAETPYFYFFSALAGWTNSKFYKRSWLEYLTFKYVGVARSEAVFYWNRPEKWHEVFRDLLRQTYQDKNFLLATWGGQQFSSNEIPWFLWEKEFKYGI